MVTSKWRAAAGRAAGPVAMLEVQVRLLCVAKCQSSSSSEIQSLRTLKEKGQGQDQDGL